MQDDIIYTGPHGETLSRDELVTTPDVNFHPSQMTTKDIFANLSGKSKSRIEENYVEEFLKCRQNVLYFIHNYCNLSEIGGFEPYKKEYMNKKFRRTIKILNRYHKCILMASRQLGKALALDTPIPLYEGGYKKMRDVVPGDILLDENGNPTTIVAESPIFQDKRCFKITFREYGSIVASEDHLWVVHTDMLGKITCTTSELVDLMWNDTGIYIQLPGIPEYLNRSPFIWIGDVCEVESVPTKCIVVDSPSHLFLAGEHYVPTHNSTLGACLLAHALNFFPGNRAIILNMDMTSGLENISKTKVILENLPSWMRFLPSSTKTKTFLELSNGSKVQVIFPSTIKSPSQLGRSLTIPILYLDEIAFIRHAEEIWTSAQPTLSTAREQALKNGYPYWILMTSTPNGTEGRGKFFFQYWTNAVDSDYIFEKLPECTNEVNQNLVYEKFTQNADEIVNDPVKNSFVRVEFPWFEDPRRDQDWYQTQCQELNFERRRISQEIDIKFTGSQNCIFDDDVLTSMTDSIKKPFLSVPLKYGMRLEVFKEVLDPDDWYLIGVDTAQNMGSGEHSNECALEIFGFKNFEQIAEVHSRPGSYNNWGSVVEQVTLWLRKQIGNRIFLGIENNTIGQATIEKILMNPDSETEEIFGLLYFEKNKIDSQGAIKEYGIKTTAQTKPLMVGCCVQNFNMHPELIYSDTLIRQCHSVQRSTQGTVTSDAPYDLFMATCFCAYMRKMKEIEIMPLLRWGNTALQDKIVLEAKTVFEMSNPTEYAEMFKKFDGNQEEVSTVKDDEALTNFFNDLNGIDSEDHKRFLEKVNSGLPFFV